MREAGGFEGMQEIQGYVWGECEVGGDMERCGEDAGGCVGM